MMDFILTRPAQLMITLAVTIGVLAYVYTPQKIGHFEGTKPALVIEDYFKGPVKGWGIVQDRLGRLRSQFIVALKGSWDKESQTLILDETFQFSDGTTTTRSWTLKKQDTHRYIATTGDTLGEGVLETRGYASFAAYRLRLPLGDSLWAFDFEDWMYLGADGVITNRVAIKKLGIKVAELIAFYKKA